MRNLSPAAEAAKQIRQWLKKEGIKASVRCQNFAGGNSINVEVYDHSPSSIVTIKNHVNQYKSGHFDGLTDSYIHDNSRDDIPQVSFLRIKNKMTIEMEQKIIKYMHENDVVGIPPYLDNFFVKGQVFRGEVAYFWRQDEIKDWNKIVNKGKG